MRIQVKPAGMRPYFRALPILLLLCVLAACENDADHQSVLAPAGYGVVEGVLRGAERPEEYTVSLWEQIDGGYASEVRTDCDSTGAFSLRAPYGVYTVNFVRGWEGQTFSYTSHGASVGTGDSITLDPTHQHFQADVTLGALRLRLGPAESYRNQSIYVHAVGEDAQGRRSSSYGSANCEGDTLEVLLGELIPASYRIQISSSNLNQVWLPLGSSEESAARIEVGTDTVSTPRFVLAEPCRILGQIHGSWQEFGSLANRPALLIYAKDSTLVDWILSNTEGEIAGTVLWGDSVRFGVAIGEVTRWIGGSSFRTATRYATPSGETLRIPAVEECGFACRLDLEDPVYEMDAEVMLYDESGLLVTRSSLSMANDLFAVCNLAPGSYYLRVHRPWGECNESWTQEWYDSARNRETATPITFRQPGEAQRFEWRLERGGTIEGGIKPPPSDPGRYLEVEVLAAEDSTDVVCDKIVRPETGVYRFTGLIEGAYVLRTSVPVAGRYRNWWYPGTLDRLKADTLQVRAGETREVESWIGW